MADRERLHAFFSGAVQGVGFRLTAIRLATSYPNLTGFVRNLPDGRVELVAEGNHTDLAAFLDDIEERMSGYVRSVDKRFTRAGGSFHGFTIAH